jgi:hypothetical protein
MTNVLVLNDTSTPLATATSTTIASSTTTTSNNNNTNGINKIKINQMSNYNENMEYDQIKYNFLKLLKQFKIFEFDKFMKWLEKLVYDYQRIGYNVIGK